jgi:hypothetical protein
LIALNNLTEKEDVRLDIVKQVYASISDHAKTKDFDNLRYATSLIPLSYPLTRFSGHSSSNV